jgi:hypothetical protein
MCVFDGDFQTTTPGPPGHDTTAVRILVVVNGDGPFPGGAFAWAFCFSSMPSCGIATTDPRTIPATPPLAGLITDSGMGFTFERPRSWQPWQPNEHDAMTSGPLLYLSTDDLLPSCAVAPDATPNPPDEQGDACTWPLTDLQPGGVLVTGYTTRLLVPLPTSGGKQIEVGGVSAQLTRAKPGECGAIGADETLDVMLPIGQPTSLSNIGVMACLRGPNLTLAESQLEAMLASFK